MAAQQIPQEMDAVYYTAPHQWSVAKRPVPELNEDEVLVKIAMCGVCGTDVEIAAGGFMGKFPLVPGHEAVGTVVKKGSKVKNLELGQRVACDNAWCCNGCSPCVENKHLFCENFDAKGVNNDGAFAEYQKYSSKQLYPIKNLTDVEACLIEPASCAIHGADVLNLPVGSNVLVIGAGPTGLLLAQILRLNGAAKMTVAANAGMKMDIARQVDAADVYVDLPRDKAEAKKAWDQLLLDNPGGFDAVIEATGVASILENAINFCAKGGTLMCYGVYGKEDKVSWNPDTIFFKELRIIGSFAQIHCFGRSVRYLDSGKLKLKGIITDVYRLSEFQDALDKIQSRKCLKVAIANGDYTKPE